MIDIVDRLSFDAIRCETTFSKGVASNIEDGIAEIKRLRAMLKQAREALDQMRIWMPSGFAPQSKDNAMHLAGEAIQAIDAYQQQATQEKS